MIEDYIVHGASFSIPTPTESAGWVLYRQLIEFVNDDKAFVDEITGKYISHREFLQLACSLAEALRKNGIGTDDVAAICSKNNIYYYVVVLAGLFTGVPITPINPDYTETELCHAFELTRPRRVFCSSTCYDKLSKLKQKFNYIDRIIVIDSNLPKGVSLIDFLNENANACTDIYNFSPKSLDSANHLAFIMFSSGTTGLPKSVMITHHNLNSRLMTVFNPQIWPQSKHPNVIGVLPFFHAFGLQLTLGDIFNHRTVYVISKFDPILYLKCIEKYRIVSLVVVPTLLVFLAKHPAVQQFDLSSLEDVIYGSAPASLITVAEIAKRLKVTPRQGYGLTETTFAVTAVPPGISKVESVGLAFPGTMFCIRDPESGRKLGPNEQGEICFKGDLIMKGYYKNEQVNKDSFTEDGFFKTGDVGYYDEDEYLYITDRMKELIKYKSFQVAPAELESVLITHLSIKQAAVVGIPDEKAGELPMAFVVKDPNSNLTEDEVKSYLANYLSRNKHLHGGVVFVDELPLNSLGKVARKELKTLLSQITQRS